MNNNVQGALLVKQLQRLQVLWDCRSQCLVIFTSDYCYLCYLC